MSTFRTAYEFFNANPAGVVSDDAALAGSAHLFPAGLRGELAALAVEMAKPRAGYEVVEQRLAAKRAQRVAS